MALWVCLDCSAAYAVGQSRCPNCLSTEYIEEGVMPKITIHGGPSNDAAGPELSEPEANLERGEEPSPGSSSETSPSKPQSSDEPKTPNRRPRARTTASPSSKDQTADSTAPGTDGDPTTSELAE